FFMFASISLPLFLHTPPPTKVSTLSLHDALPIWRAGVGRSRTQGARGQRRPARTRLGGAGRQGIGAGGGNGGVPARRRRCHHRVDRKSTRLNSSHVSISYAVFCLNKKT